MTRDVQRGDRERVLLSRALFLAAGQLSRVKTRQRTYRVVWDTPHGDPNPSFHTVPSPRRSKLPCRLSVKLMGAAMHQAWMHWDHFALDHRNHLTDCTRCPDWRCRGWVHPPSPEFNLCDND